MSSGSWTNSDNLYLQFGTSKATAELGGEFLAYGQVRVIEIEINLSNLTSSSLAATTPQNAIISNTLFVPMGQNVQWEKVELVNESVTTPTTATLSIGLIQDDRVTVPGTYGATAFLASYSLTTAGFTSVGSLNTFTVGTASVGNIVGTYLTQWNTNTALGLNAQGGYLTANLGSATSATGLVRARIYYHGVGTIAY